MAIFRTVKRNDIGKIRTLLTVSDSVALRQVGPTLAPPAAADCFTNALAMVKNNKYNNFQSSRHVGRVKSGDG